MLFTYVTVKKKNVSLQDAVRKWLQRNPTSRLQWDQARPSVGIPKNLV